MNYAFKVSYFMIISCILFAHCIKHHILVSLRHCNITGSVSMGSKLAVTSLLMALLTSGCSYFFHKDPLPEKAVAPSPVNVTLPLPPKPIEQKIILETCADLCSKHGGIKKKFCLKKCEFKKKRAEKKALREVCEAKQDKWWSRLFHPNNKRSGVDCSDYWKSFLLELD